MSERRHITTAIFYCNGTPHVGSAYEALAADVFARYWRRRLGRGRVTFLSGTDEHGDKIRRAALAEDLAPKVYTDRMSALFREAWQGLGVSFDYFVRTTDPIHERFVQEMLRRTHENGDLYFRDYEGLYCVDCERFYPEKELSGGQLCPVHNRPVERISEGNYFLRIEKYREQVRDHIAKNPGFIRPERYRNEALNMLAEPLTDLCISRPKSRLDWGIELPFDSNYVTYVWYDAFWAYLSVPALAENPGDMDAAWRRAAELIACSEHFIGKDILKTHAVYWPPILMAAGLPLFRRLNVHGWLNFGGQRMSKSSGNVRDPVSYERAFGPDVLRYFVMRELVYGLDGDFSEERLVQRYNADLANDLGNFASRVLAMAQRYCQGEVRAVPGADLETNLQERVGRKIEELDFKGALEEIWLLIAEANNYIVETEPFKLAKDPANAARVEQILANLLEILRMLAGFLEPFMPVTSWRLFELLGLNPESDAAKAASGEGLKPGHRVKPPIALFPRIDRKPAA